MSGSKKRACRKCGGSQRDTSGHCIPCARSWRAAWAKANPDKERISKAKYWRKYYAENSEKLRARTAKTAKDNPAYFAMHASKRRANQKSAIPLWFSELDDLITKEAFDLRKQRGNATGFKWHVDHIVPLQSKLVCGLHIGCNIQVIPAIGNHQKSNLFWPDMP